MPGFLIGGFTGEQETSAKRNRSDFAMVRARSFLGAKKITSPPFFFPFPLLLRALPLLLFWSYLRNFFRKVDSFSHS